MRQQLELRQYDTEKERAVLSYIQRTEVLPGSVAEGS